MPEHHRQEVSADVAAAVDYLVDQRGIDAGRVIIVAAGRACSVVERAIHEHNLDAAVVYLSPIFAEDDRDLASAVSFRPPRPALVLASAEDLYAVKSLRAFESALGSDAVRTKIYPAAGHGVSLLRDPAHFADVDAWVKEIAASPSARE
jgi:dienelactone hydrolase